MTEEVIKDAEFTEAPVESAPVEEQDPATKLDNIRFKLADLLKENGVKTYTLIIAGFDGRGVHVVVPEDWNGQATINLLAMGQCKVVEAINRLAMELENKKAEAPTEEVVSTEPVAEETAVTEASE